MDACWWRHLAQQSRCTRYADCLIATPSHGCGIRVVLFSMSRSDILSCVCYVYSVTVKWLQIPQSWNCHQISCLIVWSCSWVFFLGRGGHCITTFFSGPWLKGLLSFSCLLSSQRSGQKGENPTFFVVIKGNERLLFIQHIFLLKVFTWKKIIKVSFGLLLPYISLIPMS